MTNGERLREVANPGLALWLANRIDCTNCPNVGVNVDKAELLKALRYHCDQYRKGYEDRENDIVTCRNCSKRYGNGCKFYMAMIETDGDFYCKDGQQKEGEQE